MDTYCLIAPGAMRDVCLQELAYVLDFADNPSWYEPDVVLTYGKVISMNVYDVAFNIKGVNESETHMLQHVVILLTVGKLKGHLTLNAF